MLQSKGEPGKRERNSAILEDSTGKHAGRKQQLLTILAPLLLLIICLATINLVPALVQVTGASPSIQSPTVIPGTPVAVEDVTSDAPGRFSEGFMATPDLAPTPTAYVVSTVPPGIEIQLLGPPSGSAFRIGDTLSFYWQWPVPLAEDQSLAAYLLTGNQELLLGRLAEPNVGQSYRLHVSPSDFVDAADAVEWQVRLESAHVEQWLAASEIRPLALQAAP